MELVSTLLDNANVATASDETQIAGLHIGVIDADVEACSVLSVLFDFRAPLRDARLILKHIIRRIQRRTQSLRYLESTCPTQGSRQETRGPPRLRGTRDIAPDKTWGFASAEPLPYLSFGEGGRKVARYAQKKPSRTV